MAEIAPCGCVVGGLHRYVCASVGHVDPPRSTDTETLAEVLAPIQTALTTADPP